MRFDPPGGTYPDADERRKNQIAIQGLFAPTEQLDGTLLSSSFPALNDPAVAIDIYNGDTGLDTGRPQSLFALDPRLIDQGRLTKQARVNLRAGEDDPARLDGTVVRFDGAVPFVNLQVSHDPAQVWVLVFALTMMAGLLVSLMVRRRGSGCGCAAPARPSGTVNVELGGLARTDNSGWGDEFERLTRVSAVLAAAPAESERKRMRMNTDAHRHRAGPLFRLGVHLVGGGAGGRAAAARRRAGLQPRPQGRDRELVGAAAAATVGAPTAPTPGVVVDAPQRSFDERVGKAGLALVYVGIALLLGVHRAARPGHHAGAVGQHVRVHQPDLLLRVWWPPRSCCAVRSTARCGCSCSSRC